MTVEYLPPGTYVEVNDIMSGSRKLGLVDETGMGYFDIHGPNELPKPLFSELMPNALGSITSWLAELDDAGRDHATEIWDTLTRKNLDVLTIARAVRWALANQSIDIELIEHMGHEATRLVMMGREVASKAVSA